MSDRRSGASHRWSVASRVLAASLGGYGFTSLVTAALATSLPMARVDTFLVSTMSAFLVYLVVVMAVFRARSARRAWMWLVLVSIPPAVAIFLAAPGAAS